MAGPVYGLGASANLRADYAQQLEQLANAEWLQLQAPHGGGPAAPEAYAPEYVPPEHATWGGDPGIYTRPPHEQADIDPGIYVEPDPGWGGDPGIYAEPPALEAPAPRGRVLAPSIVPGLDWATGGPYRELGPAEEPAAASEVDPKRSMSAMDHMIAGSNGFWVPSLVGGALSGIFAASALRGTGSGLAAFGNRLVGHVLVGGLTGAAAGLLVSATSPGDGDSLAARYAIAGGLVGAATGAAFPMGTGRVIGAIGGGVSGAIIAGITGHRLDQAQ